MRLTARERTALRAMAEFARRYGDGPTALSEVSAAQGLPLPYLEHIAASLRRSGLLSSVRGAHGGYTLNKAPATVTVGDVLRAVEGPLVSIECTQGGSGCEREPVCDARMVWQAVTERLQEMLDQTSLADLIDES